MVIKCCHVRLPTELNIMGHHLYGKINNSFLHVHLSETTFSLLISYSLQCSRSEGSLVPHSHSPALSLVFLTFNKTPPSSPYRQVGLHQFSGAQTFSYIPCPDPMLQQNEVWGPWEKLGWATHPPCITMLCTEARQLKVLCFFILSWNCLHRGKGELTGWSTNSSYNNLVVSRPSKTQYSHSAFSFGYLTLKM